MAKQNEQKKTTQAIMLNLIDNLDHQNQRYLSIEDRVESLLKRLTTLDSIDIGEEVTEEIIETDMVLDKIDDVILDFRYINNRVESMISHLEQLI